MKIQSLQKRKTRRGTLKKIAERTLENQTELTNTTAYVAQLEHRANYSKAEILRSPKTQSSEGKQDSSFATVPKRRPRFCSPSVNNNIEHLNSILNDGRIAQSDRASC